jgi:hypothetical protein
VANITREAFNEIYLNLSKKPGATRFSDSGFGWKPANGETYTCDQSQILSAQWSRAARGYEVKILSRQDGVVQLDGFKPDDFDRVSKVFKTWYGINLDNREHALRGWNWGKADFGKAELTFNVANRPAFEVPYTEVSNTNQEVCRRTRPAGRDALLHPRRHHQERGQGGWRRWLRGRRGRARGAECCEPVLRDAHGQGRDWRGCGRHLRHLPRHPPLDPEVGCIWPLHRQR